MAEILSFILDCRECPNFFWDFNTGEFNCKEVKGRRIEELHLVPDWCPLPSKRSFNESSGYCKVIKQAVE